MTIDLAGKGGRRIDIFDATLRDGEQAPGNTMSPEDKLRYALAAEAFGADVIEAGFPASSPADFAATKLIAGALTTARFSTFNRCSERDIRLSAEAGGIRPNHQIAICGTGSDLHLEHKRQITRREAIAEGRHAVRLAAALGATDIAFCIEDASRGDRGFVMDLVGEALAQGATTIGLADTTGCATPSEYGDLIAEAHEMVPPDVTISTHCHDDLGLSLANALAGVQAGAGEVQATLGGIGERCGNTPLEELAAVLVFKSAQVGAYTDLRIDQLYAAYVDLVDTTGMAVPRNKAIVGLNAFATQAGIHQDGILKNPATYEFMDPARWGRHRSILVGRHSGRAVVRYVLAELGAPEDDALVDRMYEELVASRPGSDCDELDHLRDEVALRLAVSP
ncbi:LeuA family protein [Salinispora pacifica]|nr:hypothetical protein [Salinispora pacifica]